MPFSFKLDRTIRTSLTDQIRCSIGSAIESGVLPPGSRLPSWVDLATQLGVSRGTVRAAYEMLMDAQLIVASRSGGTRVSDRLSTIRDHEPCIESSEFMDLYHDLTTGPSVFRLGLPATKVLPAKLFSRIRSQAMRMEQGETLLYPDPRGELELRRAIAAYLRISRGVECQPSQVMITNGFASGLGLVLRALELKNQKVWIEDPCFPFTKKGLELAGLTPVPVPVDACGFNVDYATALAPDAALALVTPGQHAPLGMPLSMSRRSDLLKWATDTGAWIIEDDYMSELQLESRAAPALASMDNAGRVIHIGSFSKTISPALRLGFVVAPSSLVPKISEVSACLSPAPAAGVQLATAEFMSQGHYLRHLRRAKKYYCLQKNELLKTLTKYFPQFRISAAGLAILIKLPNEVSDVEIASNASAYGMSPGALSPWYVEAGHAESGIMLGIATSPTGNLDSYCARLHELIESKINN